VGDPYTLTSNYSISGSQLVCSSETYTLNGLPAGHSVSWYVSSPGVIDFTTVTSNPTTVSYLSNGEVSVIGVIKNVSGCIVGTTPVKSVIAGTGAPINMVYFNNAIGEQGFFCSSHWGNTFSVDPDVPADYEARLLSWPSMTQVAYNTNASPYAPDVFGYIPSGYYIFGLRKVNSCGASNWFETEVQYIDCNWMRMPTPDTFSIAVAPNPTDGDLYVQFNRNKTPGKQKTDPGWATYALYDFNHTQLVRQWHFKNDQQQQLLNVRGLKSGHYILTVTIGKQQVSKHIIIR